MSGMEDHLIGPEHIQVAQELRWRTRRLAHLGNWPTNVVGAFLYLLLAVLHQALLRLPVPQTVGPEGMILFVVGMMLMFGLLFLLHRAIDRKLRHALHLDEWPRPRSDSFSLSRFIIVFGLLAVSYLVVRWLGMTNQFYLFFLLWYGLTQIIAALDTRVKRYAVEGLWLLLAWIVLIGLPDDQAAQVFFPLLALAEALTVPWGWWEWRRVWQEGADVR